MLLSQRYLFNFFYVIIWSLIFVKGENGCPSGFNELENTCSCASKCCWMNCRLDEPPSNCLTEANAVWVNDTEKGVLVAQVRSGKIHCHFR